MSQAPDPGRIPVGLATKAGYSVTTTAFALAVVAYLTGDHSQQTIGVLTAGAVGALAFLVTQAGRYAQAHAAIVKGQPTPLPPTLEDTDGPGDTDALPHFPAKAPSKVSADQGDAGAPS